MAKHLQRIRFPLLAGATMLIGMLPQISFAATTDNHHANILNEYHFKLLERQDPPEFTITGNFGHFDLPGFIPGQLSIDNFGNILVVGTGGGSILFNGHSANIIKFRGAKPYSPPHMNRQGHIMFLAYPDNIPGNGGLVMDGRLIIPIQSYIGDYFVSDISDPILSCDGRFRSILHLRPDEEFPGKTQPLNPRPDKYIVAVNGIPSNPINVASMPSLNLHNYLYYGPAILPKIPKGRIVSSACNAANQYIYTIGDQYVTPVITRTDGRIFPSLHYPYNYTLSDNGIILTELLQIGRYQDAVSDAHTYQSHTDLLPALGKFLGGSIVDAPGAISSSVNNSGQVAIAVQYVKKDGIPRLALVRATPGGAPPVQGQPTVCSRFLKMREEAKELTNLANSLATDHNTYRAAVDDMRSHAYASRTAQLGLNVPADEIAAYLASDASSFTHRSAIVQAIRAKAARRLAIAEAGLTGKRGNSGSVPGEILGGSGEIHPGVSAESLHYFCSLDPDLINEDVWDDLYAAGYIDYPLYRITYAKIHLKQLAEAINTLTAVGNPETLLGKAAFVEVEHLVLQEAEEAIIIGIERKTLAEKLGTIVEAKIPWNSPDIGERGGAWEVALTPILAKSGYSFLGGSFKVFDYFNATTRTAISAKTMNTALVSYQRTGGVLRALKGYVNTTLTFTSGIATEGFTLTQSMIKKDVICLAVPEGTTAAQWQEIKAAMNYATERGVELIVSTVR